MSNMKIIISTLLLTLMPIAAQAQEDKSHNLEVAKNLELFNEIYRWLDLMYVDTLEASDVIGFGIDAMLSSLDPYTEYYPESKSDDLKMLLTGKYAGIGALIRHHQRLDKIVIEEPYAGMPSAEVGLMKGDIIISIDDSLMTGKTVSYVSEHLRGEAGTTFALVIERPSTGKTMTFKITRRNIKLPDIPYYGMLTDSIGYINFTSFTEGSAKNMRRTFLDLKKQGAQKLILDLRGNGGGSLQEAIDIISMWVPKDIVIVETKGKMEQACREYKTKLEPVDTIMPIVVMVGNETASASEITSGSIQDLDRGVIIGTRTYGKGLVQAPIELSYNSTLKLTTSKYYIPSGRCIQAVNYNHKGGGYTEHIPDSLTNVFHTLGGREVRDGGGIKPDLEVLPDTMPNIAIYLDRMDSTEVMFDYITEYIATHPTIAPASEFRLSDEEFEDFKQRVIDSGFSYDPMSKKTFDELVKIAKFEGYYDEAKKEFDNLAVRLQHDVGRDIEKEKTTLKQILEADITSAYYFQAGAIENGLFYDNQLKEAIKLLKNMDEYYRLLSSTGDIK